MRAYRQTPKGKATQMWAGILQRAENKAGKHPTYKDVKLLMTREEFMNWILPEFEAWEKHSDLKLASIDRVDNLGHYEVSNLQLLTRRENTLKQRRYKNVIAPEGKAWCGKCKMYLDVDKFAKDRYNNNGLTNICIPHRQERDRERYLRLTKG